MEIRLDIRGVDAVQRQLKTVNENLRDKVVTAALNKVASKAQAEINRAIRDEYVVKADEVRNAMVVHKASRESLTASIDIFGSKSRRGRSANMIYFVAAMQAGGMAFKTRGATGVKRSDLKSIGKQLGFRVKRGSGLKQIHGAFIANKGRTVFIREGRNRLPIKPVQVIGFSQMFSSKKISKRVMDKIDKDLIEEIQRGIKMVLAK